MKLSLKALSLAFLLVGVGVVVGCSAGDDPEQQEERVESSTSAQKCPSPITDREGFLACVKRSSERSGNSSSGNGGVERAEANGGSIRIGDVNTTGCGSVSISCTDTGCTCTANGGPRHTCESFGECLKACCNSK